jgi:hypothetical protein
MFGNLHTLLLFTLYFVRNIHFTCSFPFSQSMSTELKGKASDVEQKQNAGKKFITIIGFGSLVSERSSRTTFSDLQNFRLGRVKNYRRVFGHPASIFFQRGIANLETKEMSSLSTEFVDGHPGFICSVFEVPNDDMMVDGIPSPIFLEREEEFNIIEVPYIDLQESEDENGESKMGILCAAGTDNLYVTRWGQERFEKNYKKYGVDKIWGWERDSGLRPCAVYLRHCYLAAKSMGNECLNSFLDETFLVDRTTTVRDYLNDHPEVLETEPPPSLVGRYSG